MWLVVELAKGEMLHLDTSLSLTFLKEEEVNSHYPAPLGVSVLPRLVLRSTSFLRA